MKILEWLRAVREFMECMASPEITWDHKPINPEENTRLDNPSLKMPDHDKGTLLILTAVGAVWVLLWHLGIINPDPDAWVHALS